MIDYSELMRILSIPRPNGSAAERETAYALRDWLTRKGIAYHIHTLRLYPYFNEGIGLWLITSSALLALSIVLRWGWFSLVIAGAGLTGIILEVAFKIHVTTWLGARQGENILIEFEPSYVDQEIVLSGHYDSKTELLDHEQRDFFMTKLNFGVILTVLLGVLGVTDQLLLAQGSPWADIINWVGIGLSLVMIFLIWGFGLNLTLGRFVTPSQGAIDNGTACAILLGVADRLARREIMLKRTKVTIALFTGEEVGMQGSCAYVQSRKWPLPTIAINLEIMAQDGDYVIWQQESNVLRQIRTSPELNKVVADVVMDVTGKQVRFIESLNSDGFSFLSAGIPTTVLGTYHSQMDGGGLHRPSDNLARVVLVRLPEGADILSLLLYKYDIKELAI